MGENKRELGVGHMEFLSEICVLYRRCYYSLKTLVEVAERLKYVEFVQLMKDV